MEFRSERWLSARTTSSTAGDSPEHSNGYVIEGFVFPSNLLKNVRPLGPGKTVLPLFHPRFDGRGGSDGAHVPAGSILQRTGRQPYHLSHHRVWSPGALGSQLSLINSAR
jgi:hypothetical protein